MANPAHAQAMPAPGSKASSSNPSSAHKNYGVPQLGSHLLVWNSSKNNTFFPPTINQPSPPDEPLPDYVERLFGPGYLPGPDTPQHTNHSHQCQNRFYGKIFSPESQFPGQDLGSPAISLEPISARSRQPILDPEKNGPNVSSSLFIGTQYQRGVINSSHQNELSRVPGPQSTDFRSSTTYPANQQVALEFEQEQDYLDNLSPHIIEHQENGINHENLQSKHNWALGPAHLQPPNAISSLGIPRCGNKCRVSVGSHKCSYQGRALTISCRGNDDCSQEFTRRNDFNRHWRNIHGNRELLSCPVPDCKRVGRNGFARKDNLTQHRRLVHREVIEKNPVRFGHDNSASNPGFG